MFPARYRARERAVRTAPIGDPAGRWERLGGSAIGAADLYALFSAPGGEPSRALDDPTAAAAGWAGGEVEVWAKGPDSALAIALEEREPADRLCDSMHAWYRVGFPDAAPGSGRSHEMMVVKAPDRETVLVCRGSEVRLGIAPSLAVARALVD
jgi:hypothetical protein